MDGLRAVKRVLAAGPSGLARFRTSQILGLRQFVTGKIDYVVLRSGGWGIRSERCQLCRQNNHHSQQNPFGQPRNHDAGIREESSAGLPG
jgi:hypothetical protein